MNDPFEENTETMEPPHSGAESFFEGGSPSCRFQTIGDMHTGRVVDFKESQQRDIKTGEKAFWPDGNPKQMLVITLATNERDDEIEDDDGERRLYVNKPSGMFAAISAAIKASKNRFVAGGTLSVKYTKNGKPKTAGFNAPKEYIAKYIPPGAAPTINAPQPQIQSQQGKSPMAIEAMKSAKLAAWNAMQAKLPGVDSTSIRAAVMDAIAACYPGKTNEQLTVIQWQQLVKNDFAPVTAPYDEGAGFSESDIPF